MPHATHYHIRWMIRRDMERVLYIERDSFEFPWMEEDFVRCLRSRNCIGMVAEHDGQVVGFVVYEILETGIQLHNLAVSGDFRRCGVGAAMVAKMKQKLSTQRRTRLELMVRETNMPAILFFKAQGFRAVRVLRGFFEETDEYAYQLVYRYRPAMAEDRISQFNASK